MAVGDAYVFPGFLTPVLTQLFFPKPPTTFLTCSCRGERQKYTGKKSRLNQGLNSQPPGHESDMLTTEPPGRGRRIPKFVFLVPMLQLVNPRAGPVLTQGASYEQTLSDKRSTRRCYIQNIKALVFQFQSRRIMKFLFFVPMFNL